MTTATFNRNCATATAAIAIILMASASVATGSAAGAPQGEPDGAVLLSTAFTLQMPYDKMDDLTKYRFPQRNYDEKPGTRSMTLPCFNGHAVKRH